MQEISHNGEVGMWEELDTDKMQKRLRGGDAAGYNVRVMTPEDMAAKNKTIQARRRANKRARKVRAKARRKS